MLNRSALILKYKEPAVNWINQVDPYSDRKQITLEEANRECTVYLISEETAETPGNLRKWIEANVQELFENELAGWYQNPEVWPRKLTLKLFDEWFAVECHSMIVDTVGGVIEDDGI